MITRVAHCLQRDQSILVAVHGYCVVAHVDHEVAERAPLVKVWLHLLITRLVVHHKLQALLRSL